MDLVSVSQRLDGSDQCRRCSGPRWRGDSERGDNRDGQEKRSGVNLGTNVNPLFTAPGAGQTFNNANNLHLLTAYKLQSASPMKNAAWNLKTTFAIDMGTRDYIGTATPQGGAYDLGACELV